jgi:membrane associated rhomboid family serine protease
VPRPPPLTYALRYPATAGTLALSLAATIAWWAGVDCSRLFADAHVGTGQLHRLLISALLHRDPLHLAFNFYWVWAFGTLIERALGPWRTACLFTLLAAGSNAAELTLLHGGVGLSGVGYGLFGFLWYFWKRAPDDDRFAGGVDQRTEALFVTWFFACILLTITDVLPVANIAHGVGAVLGLFIAWSSHRNARAAYAAPIGVVAILIAAAVLARPHVNLARDRGVQESFLAYEALQRNEDAAALGWSRQATTMNGTVGIWWFNRAVAENRLKLFDDALASYSNAARLEPANDRYRTARDTMQDYLAHKSQTRMATAE